MPLDDVEREFDCCVKAFVDAYPDGVLKECPADSDCHRRYWAELDRLTKQLNGLIEDLRSDDPLRRDAATAIIGDWVDDGDGDCVPGKAKGVL